MSDLDLIKDLRSQTGAGIADIKKALSETGGDTAKAREVLRAKGKLIAQKKSGRVAGEGIIEAYIHSNKKVGALVELRCETDFVARNGEFQALAHEIALQVAATDPKYLKPEEIPSDVVEQEKKAFAEQVDKSKSSNISEQIVQGKLGKRWSELCLLNQPYIRDPEKTVQDLITEAVAKLGENIEVGRFVRYEL